MIRPTRTVSASLLGASLLGAGLLVGAAGSSAARAGVDVTGLRGSPITHVVVIMQENHSFNDMLGKLCVSEGGRCDGTTVGRISNGQQIALAAEPDIPPSVGHLYEDQVAAINGGAMNGWDRVGGCDQSKGYRCLEQVHAGAVPTLWALADQYAMSDRTFETAASGSWGSHLDLVAATMDRFHGDEPSSQIPGQPGFGCEKDSDALWDPPQGGDPIMVPSCVPDRFGKGPYRASPVAYVPTIMDSLDAAGLSWHIYAPGKHGGGYGWSICPTFWECKSTAQADQVKRPRDFAKDAAKGRLASVSILIPFYSDSQHNGWSLIKGDDWIAQNVSAVMNGPEWDSTAIFLTYDDCGCFYDPATPPPGNGIRTPMLIISPYAKKGFVDHRDASFASMLAFMEHLWGLPALPGGADGTAYDYADAFDFAQRPNPAIALPQHAVPASSVRAIAQNPPDPDDPT